MLLGGDAGHRLEPVGEMGDALFHRPVLHGAGDHIGQLKRKRFARLNGPAEFLVADFGKLGAHHAVVEHHAAEQFRYFGHDRNPPASFIFRDVSACKKGTASLATHSAFAVMALL